MVGISLFMWFVVKSLLLFLLIAEFDVLKKTIVCRDFLLDGSFRDLSPVIFSNIVASNILYARLSIKWLGVLS